jgi:hypothetical protein
MQYNGAAPRPQVRDGMLNEVLRSHERHAKLALLLFTLTVLSCENRAKKASPPSSSVPSRGSAVPPSAGTGHIEVRLKEGPPSASGLLQIGRSFQDIKEFPARIAVPLNEELHVRAEARNHERFYRAVTLTAVQPEAQVDVVLKAPLGLFGFKNSELPRDARTRRNLWKFQRVGRVSGEPFRHAIASSRRHAESPLEEKAPSCVDCSLGGAIEYIPTSGQAVLLATDGMRHQVRTGPVNAAIAWILAVDRDAPLVSGWGAYTPLGRPYSRTTKP